MHHFMQRGAFTIAVAGTLAIAVLGFAEPPTQQPVFRGTADVVRVFTTVTDRSGKLVTALTRDRFELRDQGKPQPITQFDDSPQPIRLVVMLDVSGSMAGNLSLLRAGADQLFARLLPGDTARVGTFGRDVAISPRFTADRSELHHALPEVIAPDAQTPLWRGLDRALDALREGGQERAVILVLSDGKDTSSFMSRVPVSQAEVIDRARREDVMIYAIGMRSRGPRPPTPSIGAAGLQASLMADWPDPGLARVAEDTGGGYVEIRFGQDLGAAFESVADELHTQYLLGFAPPARDGRVHEISVRMATTGLKARARRSYIAARP
jgi:VWFA-related protein